MRFYLFFIGLIAFPLSLWAFEVEDTLTLGDPDSASKLRVISTTDAELFRPVLAEFRNAHPETFVEYVVTSSSELMAAIQTEGAAFDLAISSAMDLQTKLANDGLTLPYASTTTASLPTWAR